MDERGFERLDRQMMKAARPLRDRPVKPGLEKGFAEEIEARLESGSRRPGAGAWRTWFVPVPAAAVIVLSLVVVLRLPGSRPPEPARVSAPPALTADRMGSAAGQTTDLSASPEPARPAAMTAEQVAAEIEALRQLGVWSAEDETALGDSEEILWEETLTA